MSIVVSAHHLSKGFSAERSSWKNFWSALTRTPIKNLQYAVNDVSFVINKGESVGLVGLNGTGKSTLLSLIMGILKPTSGHLDVVGRANGITSMNFAFEGERTGRSNIFYYAMSLGYTHAETKDKIDEVVEFSGLADQLDLPVKTYSSGMYARLAFSVASHFDPDILIVDEILTVGDITFKAKCAEKIKEIQKRGTTFILVSHDTNELIHYCQRGIWMNQGKIMADGPIQEICHYYTYYVKQISRMNLSAKTEVPEANSNSIRRFGNGKLKISKVHLALASDSSREISACMCGDRLVLSVYFDVMATTLDFDFGFNFLNKNSVIVWGSMTNPVTISRVPYNNSINHLKCEFQLNLTAGEYLLYVGLKAEGASTDEIWPVRTLEVLPTNHIETGISYGASEFYLNDEKLIDL